MKTITIDGIEYDLVKKVSPENRISTYIPKKIGNKFKHEDGSEYLLCACMDQKVQLSNIDSGLRLEDGISVKNMYSITEKEWCVITAHTSCSELTPIDKFSHQK